MNHENYENPQESTQNTVPWDALQNEPFRGDFDHFNEIANSVEIPLLTHLNSTNPEAKQEFLTHPELERPNNEWAKLNGPLYEANLATIAATKEELENSNLPYRERLLVDAELEFARKKNRLALTTYEYNNATTEAEKSAAAAEHQTANVELYGMPEEATFQSLLHQKLNKIDVANLTPEQNTAYQELTTMLGDIPQPDAAEPYEPRPETIQRFSEMMREFYKPFLRHIPEGQEVFTPQDAADIVNEILATEFSDNTDSEPATEWQAEVKPNAGLASVDAATKKIKFPGARSKGDYDRSDLEKIIIHELGTHAFRALVVEDSPIQAFRSESFDGREVFEEGIAKVMEQALEGRADDPASPAPSRYIMIGLANLYGTNFRQTFEIMRRLESLTGGWNEGQIYDNLQRVYRGTGVLPNNKDLAYYNGNVEAWKYVESHLDDPDLFDNIFLSGKIDSRDHDQSYLSYELRTGSLG